MIKLSVLFSGLWIYKVTLFLRATGTHVAAALIKFPTRAPKHKRSTSVLYLPAFLQLHMAQYRLLALPSLLYCSISPPGPHYSHHSIDLPTSDQSEIWSRSQSSIQGWTSLSTRTHTHTTKTPQHCSLELLSEKVHLISPQLLFYLYPCPLL